MSDNFRTEIIAITVKYTVLAAFTMFTIKYLIGRIDPNSEQKKNAYKKVRLHIEM